METKQATEADYKTVQGGKPKVAKQGKLTVVTHDYPGGSGRVVSSHKPPTETVILNTTKGPVEFLSALLERFHGKPCENQSIKSGGDPYPRTK
ncbi:MAG: hypothetical protein UX80_C0018G0007 [Candidatus Amesbacteria bacterium GW2011_GWA2_47_11b]|uniref:Uncharacterized protein n=2 Tax=Candidatus Amesiibacteriota TaxID=1752730 RepID=A0A0G1UMX8_9BACT|nr:MAG: hypothetical protein UX42_C0018G0005 [Microgenomates group bacterium GW2011_GWC1_46_20]KKU57353.1 MAG: hypothetical protein UX80_C0018G0007 [Candidatus Amesbacteria bacterium GW2011_GWA2_47_11b]KKU67433.1 MAG: hypothetical protein UX92_C0031G0007 [Candidatus Amesbacteria bacterium GW2011_GWA1_47_20]